MRHLLPGIVTAGAILAAACSDGTGPRASVPLSLAFSTRRAPAPPSASVVGGDAASAPLSDGPETITEGPNTLIITEVELVLREVELERVEIEDCDAAPVEDECEEFETDPFLLDLPLGGGTERVFMVGVAPGDYDEVELELHKPSDDPADLVFVDLHPDFADISIRVVGTFNGAGFTFISDLNAEQELALDPILSVPAAAGSPTTPTNLTIRVNLDAWFRDAAGALVDPTTANKGGANENLVRDNIIDSFEGFQDDDADGLDDEDEDPDGGEG